MKIWIYGVCRKILIKYSFVGTIVSLAMFVILLLLMRKDLVFDGHPWENLDTWLKISLILLLVLYIGTKYLVVQKKNVGLLIFNSSFDLLLLVMSILEAMLVSDVGTSNFEFISMSSLYVLVAYLMVVSIFYSYYQFFIGVRNVKKEDGEQTIFDILKLGLNILIFNTSIIMFFSVMDFALVVQPINNQLLIYSGISDSGKPIAVTSLLDIIYYNTVTYFGIGYGDILPVLPITKIFTMVEAHLFHLNSVLLITAFVMKKPIIPHLKLVSESKKIQLLFYISIVLWMGISLWLVI